MDSCGLLLILTDGCGWHGCLWMLMDDVHGTVWVVDIYIWLWIVWITMDLDIYG